MTITAASAQGISKITLYLYLNLNGINNIQTIGKWPPCRSLKYISKCSMCGPASCTQSDAESSEASAPGGSRLPLITSILESWNLARGGYSTTFSRRTETFLELEKLKTSLLVYFPQINDFPLFSRLFLFIEPKTQITLDLPLHYTSGPTTIMILLVG